MNTEEARVIGAGQLHGGLILRFFPRPHPLGGRIDIADDRLAALNSRSSEGRSNSRRL